MAELDLSTLQGWMMTACTSAGGITEGLRVCGARYGLTACAVVKATSRLSAEDRLDIYARGYLARLLECLKAEYPALHALVGPQVFGLFAQAYVWAHPPRSYSLFDFSAGFPDFLEETRPQPPRPAAGSSDALPAALARLERARQEAQRAPGVETDPTHQQIDPLTIMTMPQLRVHTPQSLRLLRLDFALTDTLATADRGDRPAIPPPADTHYAVARNRYHVGIHVLTPWQHAFLQACGTRGVPLHTAVGSAAQTSELAPTDIWAALLTWLPLAVDAGMTTVQQAPDDKPQSTTVTFTLNASTGPPENSSTLNRAT